MQQALTFDMAINNQKNVLAVGLCRRSDRLAAARAEQRNSVRFLV